MAAKMLGVLRPTVHRFKLGEFEITTIYDGVATRDGPHPAFGGNVDAATAQAHAVANRLPIDRFENSFVPALVNTGNELILFDTGNGDTRRESGSGNLLPLLASAGYAADDVDIVVITHGHPDHILGLVEGGKPAFPNARIIFGRAEYDFWARNENMPEHRVQNQEVFMKVCGPFAEQATFIEPGEDVVSGITAVEAYGHSAGHMAYHIESAGTRLLLWADVTNHYVMSVQKPEWHFGIDDDKDRAVETRKRVLDMVATEKLWVVGFHMPFPSIGFVDGSGGSYRWVPASYQLTL
ncbi:MAG: MBL fold metallo-hydrolase [Rhizobiales bacterium]|nr:MBL fold metallo-hydrolase [Hyphomicrobiales bacterium]